MSKKQQIIQAAIELFAQQGFEKTPISAICEHAGVSKGAVFHYFKNKDELLRAAFIDMAEVINQVEEHAGVGNLELSPEQKLVALLEQIFSSMAHQEKQLSYQFEFQILSQPSTRKVLEDLIEQRYMMMMGSFQPILQQIPNAHEVVDSHMLIAEIDGIAINYVFGRSDYPLEQIKTRFINKYLLLLGFQPLS